ncbi:general substrate transporter [Phascolomyces articulosus]|uniref:General substrate transporter n=1 Tax=Phascolomyces articulosus TaxID=60185 RepID=A0AAD5JZX0_9FUNG|nr:general substrate transporter [Phascolomyces articulosus]
MDSREAGVCPFVLFCAIVASLGALNGGINMSALNIPEYFVRNCPDVASGIMTYFPGSTLPRCIPMDDLIWGIATGMFALGGIPGALIAGRLAESLGRRDAMLVTNITFLIGAVLISVSTTTAMFIIGRIFVGMGSGAMTVLVSMYTAEISPPKQRGVIVGLLQLFFQLGFVVIQLCGLGLQSSIGWRVISVITVAPALLQVILLPFCARSPRWLLNQNRNNEAHGALLKLRRGNIELEFNDMAHLFTTDRQQQKTSSQSPIHNEKISTALTPSPSSQPEKEQDEEIESLSLLQILRIPILAIVTMKMMVIHAGFQLCGIAAIMYYSTSLFQAAFDGSKAAYVTVGASGVFFVFTIIGLTMVDRLGRKVLIFISAIGMSISSIIMTVALVLEIPILQVIAILLFVSAFAVGLGICAFLLSSESFPTYAVSAGCSIALMTNWFFNFVVGLLFPTLLRVLDNYVFVPFAIITFLLALFTWFFIVETAGKSIDDIGRESGWYDLDPKEFLKKKK